VQRRRPAIDLERTGRGVRREVPLPWKFDLVLLDLQLGGSEYDGIELCKIIKRRPGTHVPPGALALRCDHIPVVFVTAYASRYDKATLLQAGADEVVTKPVDYTRLLLVSSRLAVKNLNSP
jgi:CheY-like chemotaxis protein